MNVTISTGFEIRYTKGQFQVQNRISECRKMIRECKGTIFSQGKERKCSESNHKLRIQNTTSHCVKNVHIRSYSGPYFPAFGLSISPYSIRMRENTDQHDSKYGHFSRSIWKSKSMVLIKFKILYLNTKTKDRMSHDFTFTTQKRWFRVPELVSDFCAKMQFGNINIQFWNTV